MGVLNVVVGITDVVTPVSFRITLLTSIWTSVTIAVTPLPTPSTGFPAIIGESIIIFGISVNPAPVFVTLIEVSLDCSASVGSSNWSNCNDVPVTTPAILFDVVKIPSEEPVIGEVSVSTVISARAPVPIPVTEIMGTLE